MYKSTAVFLFVILATLCSYSQVKSEKNFECTLSKPYKVVDARGKYYLTEGNTILMMKFQDAKVVFQKFSTESLQMIDYKETTDMENSYSIESLQKIGNSYYLFYSIWDKENLKEQLFYRIINYENCSFYTEGVKIVTVNHKITGSPAMTLTYNLIPMMFGTVDKFNIQSSFDGSRILVQYRFKPDIKDNDKSHAIIGLQVFDNNMKQIWGKEVEMPYTESKMENYDYSVNQYGDAFALATVANDKAGKSDEVADYHIEFLHFEAMTGKMTSTEINPDFKFINNLWMFESTGDNMISAGYYSNNEKNKGADGLLIIKSNREGKTVDTKTYEIPAEILTQFENKRTEKQIEKNESKDKAEMPSIIMKKMVMEEDGSTILIGEEYYVKRYTTHSSTGYTTYYIYHYNDMLITKIGADGKLAWMKKLPKQQLGSNGEGSMSFSYFFKDNQHYLLYLDNVKNINLPLSEKPEVHKDGAGGYLTAYKVSDDNGEVEKLSFFNIENVNGVELFQFQLNRIIQVPSKDFIVEAYKKNKEDILVKIHMKD